MTNKIAQLTEAKLWLAPLAGYTDQPFRKICKEWGADVVVSEMISADGIVHKQRQTLAYLDFSDAERPFGVQLFGSSPLIMAQAAEIALTYNPDFIDVNMGCPVKKVIKRGAGGALMSDLPRALQIVKEVKQVLPAGFPLSVKFRSGADINKLNFLDFGKAIQDAGADIIILHPRTVKQMFTGVSNWKHIAELKKHVSIPVVGNGDVKSWEDYLELHQITGCDSVMIGRGILGHPWLFAQIKSLAAKNPKLIITAEMKLKTIFKHLDFALEIKPERLVVREIRAQLCYYTKGISGSAKLRDTINHTDTVSELKNILTYALHQLY